MTQIQRQDEPGQLSLDIPAAHSAGRMARQILRSFALEEGVPEDEVGTLEFVAGELLDNAIDHGGGGAAMEEAELETDVRMSLSLRIQPESWVIEVSDKGGGDPGELLALIQPSDGIPNLDDPRGRGFFLIQGMVDRLEVEGTLDGAGVLFRATHSWARGQ